MKRVELSTWIVCSETGQRLEKGTLCYQDLTTSRVYSLGSNRVKQYLQQTQDGCLRSNEEPHFEQA